MKQYQLPREFAEKWIAALRSGEYKQGRYALFNITTGGYCCLGVACKVVGASDEMLKGAFISIEMPLYKEIPDQLLGTKILVNEVAHLNDVQKKSFPEIADWIEQNVEFV